MSETILARRVLSAKCAPYGAADKPVDGHWRITATAKLTLLQGNQHPYFSATAEIAYNRGEPQAVGCLHDEIVHYFPRLAPVVLVHLADDHGRPMGAVGNAVYWSGLSVWRTGKPMAPDNDYGRRTLETDEQGIVWAPETLAHHLRVSVDKARELRAYVISCDGSAREAWAFAVRELEPQWQAEADAALAVIKAGA